MRSASSKLALILCVLSSMAWAASPQFSGQKRIGLTTGDQWEPAVAADGSGRVYVLYPHYGRVPNCKGCRVPTMLLVASNDYGKTWQAPHVMLESGSGQFDAQIAVDPADRHTVYAAWLQNGKRAVMLAKSVDSGVTWAFAMAVRSDVELDKPALAVRGQNVYVAFNHEEEVWVAASPDGGRSFTSTRVNTESRPGWSLLGAATVDPAGSVYLAWASYSKAGGARGAVNLYVAKPAARTRNVVRRIWARRSLYLRMPPELFMRSGARAARRWGHSEFISRHRPMAAKTGCHASAFPTPSREWNMPSRQSWPEIPATSASHGWIRAALLLTLCIGTLTIGVRATAEPLGEKRFVFRATFQVIAISLRKVSVFPSATISRSPLTTMETPTWSGAKG